MLVGGWRALLGRALSQNRDADRFGWAARCAPTFGRGLCRRLCGRTRLRVDYGLERIDALRTGDSLEFYGSRLTETELARLYHEVVHERRHGRSRRHSRATRSVRHR